MAETEGFELSDSSLCECAENSHTTWAFTLLFDRRSSQVIAKCRVESGHDIGHIDAHT